MYIHCVCVDTVSYTHLDVYKRQDFKKSLVLSRDGICLHHTSEYTVTHDKYHAEYRV